MTLFYLYNPYQYTTVQYSIYNIRDKAQQHLQICKIKNSHLHSRTSGEQEDGTPYLLQELILWSSGKGVCNDDFDTLDFKSLSFTFFSFLLFHRSIAHSTVTIVLGYRHLFYIYCIFIQIFLLSSQVQQCTTE